MPGRHLRKIQRLPFPAMVRPTMPAGIDLPYPVIIGIGDIDIPGEVGTYASETFNGRSGRRSIACIPASPVPATVVDRASRIDLGDPMVQSVCYIYVA